MCRMSEDCSCDVVSERTARLYSAAIRTHYHLVRRPAMQEVLDAMRRQGLPVLGVPLDWFSYG